MLSRPPEIAKKLYRRAMRGFDSHQRSSLRFKSAPNSCDTTTIYVLAPDYDRPSGGTMVLYRHVDILNAAGFSAKALHRRPGFRYTWFDNHTRTTDLAATHLSPRDIVVFPETDSDLMDRLPPGIGTLIFNQNTHLTWQRSPAPAEIYHPSRRNFLGVITVSAHNQAMLSHAFVDTKVERVHLGIDERQFWSPPGQRHRRIAYMPRRGRADADVVLNILKQRGMLQGWDIVPLDGLRHDHVAQQLRASMIFLSFSHQEGFGLPAAEAMACGNYVIGYHGLAGREFFNPHFSQAIESSDVTAFACATEQAILHETAHPGWCRQKGERASQFVLSEYSRQREAAEVAEVYRRLCNTPNAAQIGDTSALEHVP